MKTKKITRKEITKLLIRFQDECDLRANSLATQAIKDFGLRKEHQQITGNPDESYELRNPKPCDSSFPI